MRETMRLQGLDVVIEGQGPTVVFLHGWPDTLALWDDTVQALHDGYRCVRFSLPGFDLSQPPRPQSVDDMCALIGAVVDAVSPGEPVALVLHDWGCFFGYEYAARHVDRVARVVSADIGDTNSGAYLAALTAKEKRMIAGYQIWLALAWKLGSIWPAMADRMTRYMARRIGCKTEPSQMGWQMNYPYALQWLGSFGGLRGVARVDKVFGPKVPTLFLFGKRKPFMFHSARWLAQLATTPGCAVQGLDAGHWLMRQQPEVFNRAVRQWLDASRVAAEGDA
ncbi:alpha/beta hydrolase [Hydrogenophaga sp. PAMC20947]|uniref:alpha/beta fold hydrolase n=1 Tax=Hydrogenophaga sp. PAMC20947 TaxID=2565558 RepID=UPI00109E139A|nr:alpha/beta hydrolase [Hydrogenophaga sp. PAMC20947]QCB45184.1 alpha/beta hydrolase [Hydrogenophaga sp. PAMC20947]